MLGMAIHLFGNPIKLLESRIRLVVPNCRKADRSGSKDWAKIPRQPLFREPAFGAKQSELLSQSIHLAPLELDMRDHEFVIARLNIDLDPHHADHSPGINFRLLGRRLITA